MSPEETLSSSFGVWERKGSRSIADLCVTHGCVVETQAAGLLKPMGAMVPCGGRLFPLHFGC